MCSSRRLQVIRSLGIFLSLWAAHGRAWADQPLQDRLARAHFVAGESYFEAKLWDEAAHEFVAAYELSGRVEMLINLSRAQERAGRLAAAIVTLGRVIEQHPDTIHRAEAEAERRRLQRMLAAAAPDREPSVEHGAVAAPVDRAQVSSEAAPREGASPAPAHARPAQHDSLEQPAHIRHRRAMFGLATGATAVAVAALATGLRAHYGYLVPLERRCPGGACPDESYRADRDRGARLAGASTALSLSAAIAGAAAAGLWVRQLRWRRKTVALQVALSGALGRANAALRARF